MKMRSYSLKLVTVALLSLMYLLPFSLQAMDNTKPLMLKDKYYKEYWEQFFLFDDGTFVSSQFTVANLPWPVGKEHGILVATVVSPEGERTIIKNGRNPDKWAFDPENFDLTLHTHRLKSEGDGYNFHIGTKGGNVYDITGKTEAFTLDNGRINEKKGYLESSIYLPYFEGTGNWNVRPDKKQPFVSGAGKVQGFGIHALFTGRVETLLKSWLRINGLRREDNSQPLPFLSAIENLDGSHTTTLTLKKATGEVIHFSDITVEYKDFKEGKKKSTYPTVIELKAVHEGETLSGTIRFTRKIDHFNINEHLNFLERSFTRSRASVTNYRYIAEYDLTYVTVDGLQKLTGKALSEYQDIQSPKKKKPARKKRRR